MRDEIIDHTGPLPPLAPKGRLPTVYLLIHGKLTGITDDQVNEAMKEAGISPKKGWRNPAVLECVRLWREWDKTHWTRPDFVKAVRRYKEINNSLGGDL